MNRVGFVTVSDSLRDRKNPLVLMGFLHFNFKILYAKRDILYNCVKFLIRSSAFYEVEEGEQIPEYKIIINELSENNKFTLRKLT